MKRDFMQKIGSDVNSLGGTMGILMSQVKDEIKETKKKQTLEREMQQENFVQKENLKAIEKYNTTEEDAHDQDADIGMATIKKLCFEYEQQIEFGPPVKFTIRKLPGAGDSRSKEVLDIYMSSLTTEPNAKNYQLHRQLKFGEKTMANYEAKAEKPQIYHFIFDQQCFAIDPDEPEGGKFGVSKVKNNKAKSTKNTYKFRKLYISLVGDKACELDI